MAVLYKEQHQGLLFPFMVITEWKLTNCIADTPNDKLAALLPSSDKETHMLEAMVKAGA
jgi:hypothetical protein